MKSRLPRVRIASVMSTIVVAAFAFTSLRMASSVWAGWVVFLTLGALCWAVLAAVYRRGARRAFWVGFALVGSVYMGLTCRVWWREEADRSDLPTTRALSAVYPYLDPVRREGGRLVGGGGTWLQGLLADPDAQNRRIRVALETMVKVSFPNETPLEDVLAYFQSVTTASDLPSGIPIYVDQVGLQAAEKTLDSPITMSVSNMSVRSLLKYILDDLGLTYRVEDGLLRITNKTTTARLMEPEAFLRIGHCWWAWLLGAIGGCAAVGLRATRDPSPDPAPTGV